MAKLFSWMQKPLGSSIKYNYVQFSPKFEICNHSREINVSVSRLYRVKVGCKELVMN